MSAETAAPSGEIQDSVLQPTALTETRLASLKRFVSATKADIVEMEASQTMKTFAELPTIKNVYKHTRCS